MKKPLLAVIILLLSVSNFQAQDKNTSTNSQNKITTNDDYNYIAINQIKMWVSNNGMGSGTPPSIFPDYGFHWPGGENAIQHLVYRDGLIFGGYIGETLTVNGNKYFRGLQAGKILSSGLADDPSLSKYRIYKIRKGWEELPPGPKKERYQKDYVEWQGNEGAPFYDSNNDGVFSSGIDKPLFLGDEVLWCVMNDMDYNRRLFERCIPTGLEIQMSVYGYTHLALADVVFKKYLIMNKGKNTIDSMFFSYWSDPDLGNNNFDDFVGCDTLLSLAYCYNADNDDEWGYGENPPAVGFLLLQGSTVPTNEYDSARVNNRWVRGIKDKKMTSFSTIPYIDSSFWGMCWYGHEPISTPFWDYNCINGLICDGSPHINPIDNIITKYPFSGNPVDSTGWNMGYQNLIAPGDWNMYLNSGPITMAPGDTQEVVIAIIAARGSSNLQSVAALKNTAKIVKYFYDNYTPELSNINYTPPIPEYYYLGQNYPNPFNPKTQIDYELPLNGLVTLKVYDILGREIATLVNEEKTAGKHQVDFSANNLSSGIYIYTLNSRAYSKTKKMVVIK